MSRRRGYSLIELMTVVTVASLMMLFAWPRVRQAKFKSDLRSARMTMGAMFGRARASAIQYSRTTTLVFSGNKVLVTATPRLVTLAGSTIDTIGSIEDLGTAYGATITSGAAAIAFSPRGLTANNGTVTVKVSHDEFQDSIVISGFGRLLR